MIICSPQLGLSPESNLGGEVYDREMLKALADLGVEIHIILPLGKAYPRHRNFHVYFLPIPFVWPPYLFNFFILPYLFWIYWRHHYTVLRVHSPYFVGPGAVVLKTLFKSVRVVPTYHHLENNPVYDFIDRFLINKYDCLIAVSFNTKKEIVEKFQIASRKVSVINNGVDLKFRPLPKRQKLVKKFKLEGKKVILYLGQLIERKNIPFLFEVLKKLPKNYTLMICGGGPLSQELEKKAPDGVVFTGRILENDKVDYYNLADIFVYPSILEGFGMSILEAMACGKAIVATNLPSFGGVCKGKGGCILLPLETGRWVKAIIALASARVFRHVLRSYSWEAAARTYQDILSQ